MSSSAISLPQQLSSVSLEDSPTTKMVEFAVPAKRGVSWCPSSNSSSLNHMICHNRTNSLKIAQSALMLPPSATPSSSVSFDYGYGDSQQQPDGERPNKRRRFERRNSKTPAMLMAMSATLDLDFLRRNDEEAVKSELWDGGLEIAEELVKHLQQRRKSNAPLV